MNLEKQRQMNVDRVILLDKGYCTISDVEKFFGIGYHKAKKVIDDIQKDIKKQGIETIGENVVLTSRLVDYLGTTESAIRKRVDSPTKGLNSK